MKVKQYEDCDITPPGTFSPRLPETNQFPEKENVNLVARKEGEMVPRLHLGEPKPGPNIVGI